MNKHGLHILQSQVMIFLKWLRYVIEVVVWERPHVILNVDETSLSTVKHEGKGFISGRRFARRDARLRLRDAVDRFNTWTTCLAVVGDCPALQPLHGIAYCIIRRHLLPKDGRRVLT